MNFGPHPANCPGHDDQGNDGKKEGLMLCSYICEKDRSVTSDFCCCLPVI